MDFILTEKALSVAQQRIMGMALAYKRGELESDKISDEIINISNSMTEKQLRDFAKTKHKGLPDKIKEWVILASVRNSIRSELNSLDEAFKKIIRNKKMIRRKVCRPGFKLVDGRCKKMSSTERITRRKSAKKASRKRRSSKAKANRNRKKSLLKRKRMGL